MLSILTRMGRLLVHPIPRHTSFSNWKHRAALFEDTGRWPLLISPKLLEREQIDELTPEDVLTEAGKLDPSEIIRGRQDEFDEVDVPALDASLPARNLLQIADEPLDKHHLALVEIPCQAPWSVLTVLPFGGWNNVPTDAELTAVLQHWREAYGMYPISVTTDALELYLPRAPEDPALAAKFAEEIFALCPDVSEPLQAFAQSVLNCHIVHLWWD